MNINTNLPNFIKKHKNKNHQVIFHISDCKNNKIIENIINNFLIKKNSFIFESVEKGIVKGRYTIFGKKPDKIWEFNNNKSYSINKYNIKTFENVHKYAGDSFYKDFDMRKKTNNIFISSKLATSKDLFISDKYNKWITNIYSRSRVHLMRSNHDCIITSSKTIIDDNPRLTCRINGLNDTANCSRLS